MTHPTVSVVMPVHNTARFVQAAISSVLTQTFSDFELLIIDDQGTDDAIDLCRQFVDPRIRIISQENRGLAGARNTGIRQAKGRYIALLDSDDLWLPEKLERHVAHLDANSDVGVSYAASRLMADDGTPLSVAQRPKLTNITSDNIFLRNPVGNGSAAVIRRKALGEIAHTSHRQGEMNYFDESFRQSEDIECWTRIALLTGWEFEGIQGIWTLYRVNDEGLSANVIRQFDAWLRVKENVRTMSPSFAKRWEDAAEAYQLRYLARRAIRMGDKGLAINLALRAVAKRPQILLAEPVKTATTLAAAILLRYLPTRTYMTLQTRLMGA